MIICFFISLELKFLKEGDKVYPLLRSISECSAIELVQKLGNMSSGDRAALAMEVRGCINMTVRENGGHLGPNLGAVEIIIACHCIFQLNRDRLIFDVGHQSYPHKLLTGRFKKFHTLRQKGGVSGYPDQRESAFDVFRSGHASTAISTALGLGCGYSLQKTAGAGDEEDKTVIALVGDGSMTGGMAFEGLNHAGHLQKNLVIILNDNSMSISPTVGGLAKTFNRLRHVKIYEQFRDESIKQIKKIPRLGKSLEQFLKSIFREANKALQPSQIFTVLGIDYLGPVDGNDIEEMISVLRLAKRIKKPVVIHALTKKGKGYRVRGGEEEMGPHALAPVQANKGVLGKKEAAGVRVSYSICFADTLIDLSRRDDRIVAITAAMEEGTGLARYKQAYEGRYFDVGICEAHATGFCAGLSGSGLRPVFAVYSTFLQRAFDQIFHELVLQQDLPVLFCIDRAGLVGDDGPSHHGLYDIAYLRIFPSFVLMAPKDGRELELQISFALGLKGPVAIRYPRSNVPALDCFSSFPGGGEEIRLGEFEVLQRGRIGGLQKRGREVCLFAYGSMVEVAGAVAQRFLEEGVVLTLVNARFAKPINRSGVAELLRGHKWVIVLEEGCVVGGLGSAILEAAREIQQGADRSERAFFSADKIICYGIPDRLIEHASREEQLKECGLDAESIFKKARLFLESE